MIIDNKHKQISERNDNADESDNSCCWHEYKKKLRENRIKRIAMSFYIFILFVDIVVVWSGW